MVPVDRAGQSFGLSSDNQSKRINKGLLCAFPDVLGEAGYAGPVPLLPAFILDGPASLTGQGMRTKESSMCHGWEPLTVFVSVTSLIFTRFLPERGSVNLEEPLDLESEYLEDI